MISRFTFAAGAALATLLVVPTVADGGAPPTSLEDALKRTIAALEYLGGVEQRLRERDPLAIELARAATEPSLAAPNEDPSWRDARLEELRHDVARLQNEIEQRSAFTLDLPQARPTPVAPTTGLDDRAREELFASVRGAPAVGEPAHAPVAQAQKKTLEADGYVADSTKLAHACFRNGDFERALALFAEKAAVDIDASYWHARCLEQLGRTAEALAALESVVARGASTWAAARAKEDLEFLSWRVALEKKTAARGKQQP